MFHTFKHEMVLCWNLTSKRRKNFATIWLTDWTQPLVGIDQWFISHLLENGTTSFLTWMFGRVKSMTPYWWCEFRVFIHKDAIFYTQGTNNAKSGRIFKFHGGFYKLYFFHVWIPHFRGLHYYTFIEEFSGADDLTNSRCYRNYPESNNLFTNSLTTCIQV